MLPIASHGALAAFRWFKALISLSDNSEDIGCPKKRGGVWLISVAHMLLAVVSNGEICSFTLW